MAEKQATVYIVDLGHSMGEIRHGRTESDLDYALKYVWDRITTTVGNGRKTDCVGVLGLRTDESANDLAETDKAYNNVSVLHPIGQMLMPGIRQLKEDFKPSSTEQGDGISAIVVAIQMISGFCRHLKYIKKIVLVTNGTGLFDPDGLDDIALQIERERIELTVLGVDFDDAEFGVKEEDKHPSKASIEELLQSFTEKVDGNYGTMAEALYEMAKPRLKSVRPVASYKGKLILGHPEKYPDSCLLIDVERYPRTMIAKPVSASNYAIAPEESSSRTMELDDRGDKGLQAVKNARAYQVEDAGEPGGKMDIDRDTMDKGYKYGRTIVPISQTDESVTKLETQQSMEIVGFIPSDIYKRQFSMSTTNVIVGQKGNEQAHMALSSLIHALYELESYALVRFVKKNDEAPAMMILAPEINEEHECLIDVMVPFMEDVRPYKFPSLGVVKTITGKVLDKHRNIPTSDMEKYMSDYVDAMDLDTFGKDDDGKPTEYAPPEDTFSPILHRINQVIRHRAVHPDAPLPPTHEILVHYSHPPKDLIELAQKKLNKLITACDVKKVDLKAKSKRGKEPPKPKSGLDLDALLNAGAPRTKKPISADNAIPDFKNKIDALVAEDSVKDEDIEDAVKEMMGLAKELVKTSVSRLNYARACEYLGVLRTTCEDLEFWEIYNRAMGGLREEVKEGALEGDRSEFWAEVRRCGLGLFERGEIVTAGASKEEVAAFYLL